MKLTSFFASLSGEQQRRALAYQGEENHGSSEFSLRESAMITQARIEGYEAFQCGDDESDNPYEPDTPESKEWCDGFKQAQDDEVKEDDNGSRGSSKHV